MKYLVFLICIILFPSFISISEPDETLKFQTSGTAAHLKSISFCDKNYGMAAGHEGIILKTTNGGKEWTPLKSTVKFPLLGICYIDYFNAVAVGTNGTIIKTTDGGTSWIQKESGTSDWLYSISFPDAKIGIAAGTSGTLARTDDGGESWKIAKISSYNFYGIYFTGVNNGWIAGGSYNPSTKQETSVILKTTDGGKSWKETIIPGFVLLGIYFNDANTGWAVGNKGTIIKTVDGGKNWIRQKSGTNIALYAAAFCDTSHGIAAGGSGTILSTSDGGNSWTAEKSQTNSDLYGISHTDRNFSIAGLSGTILHMKLNGIMHEGSTAIPEKFQLMQNYPNPFNPATTIIYELPSKSFVELKIFDILGREVSTLISKEQNAGRYQIQFDGSLLSSGVYFCIIKAGEFSASKKLLLLK